MTQWSGGDKGTGRVCNGAHERARFSSVAPRHVIRTVVTPARQKGERAIPIGRVLTLTTRTLVLVNPSTRS